MLRCRLLFIKHQISSHLRQYLIHSHINANDHDCHHDNTPLTPHCLSSPSPAIVHMHQTPKLYDPNPLAFQGYLNSSSLRNHSCFFFLVVACSAHTCLAYSFMNLRMYLGSHSSLATPRSLQHRISALLLQPSVAVGMPSGEK